MKKSVKVIFAIVLVVSLFMLVSCKPQVAGGENPRETSTLQRIAHTGTEGVEIKLIPNYPPETIYDINPLVAIIEVRNKGSHKLDMQSCFVHVTGFDPSIIGGTFLEPLSCANNVGELEGKNAYNTEGGFNQVEFNSPGIKLPPGVYEYNPKFNFLTCYAYKTFANPLVCVDPLFYQITSHQKSCIPKNVGLGGGQGAPVGVSHVGVDMIGNKAVFEINVQNYGKGRVVSPDTDIRTCGQAALQYTDLDKIEYNVHLSGATPIACKPSDKFVRLNQETGKIICSFSIDGPTAYEAPLSIELNYNYINSYTKNIRIVRTPE